MRVDIDTTSTFYQKIGKGPAVVLLHGWGCDWQIWSPLIPELSKKYQLLIPDLPGFGTTRTTDVEHWDSQRYLQWLETLISETIGDQPFVLVGHSLGGKIAALFAAHSNFSSNIQKLIIVDASGIPSELSPSKTVQKNILKLIPNNLKNLIPTDIKSKILQATNSSTDYFLASPEQKKLLQTLIQEDIRDDLGMIKSSTAIFWGVNDPDTPIKHAYIFKDAIKNSTLEIFEQSGHFPFIDETGLFLTKLKQEL